MPAVPAKLKDAQALVAAIRGIPKGDTVYEAAQRAYTSTWDPKQDWTGPRAADTEPQDVRDAQDKRIARTFTTRDLIAEAVDGHLDAVLGLEPDYGLTPVQPRPGDEATDAEQRAWQEALGVAAELTAPIIVWWDDEWVLEALRDAAAEALLGTEAAIRLRYEMVASEGEAATGFTLDAEDEADAWSRLHVEPVAANRCYFGRDSATRQPFSVVVYDVEVDGKTVQEAEVSYLTPEGLTVLVRIDSKDTATEGEGIDLGGRLWHVRLRTRRMVTRSFVNQQGDWNRAATMENMNLEYAGFRQRDFLNAHPPGEYVLDAAAPGGRKFVRDPKGIRSGPGVSNFIFGPPSTDAVSREVTYGAAQVVTAEPVSNEVLHAAQDRAEEAVFSMAKQRHRLVAIVSGTSGETLKQARQEFEVSLAPTVRGGTKALVETVDTALAIVALAAGGQVATLERFRVFGQLRVFAGPLTSDEVRVLTERWEKGGVSTETYLSRIGEADPDAEMGRMRTNGDLQPAVSKQRAETFKIITDAGADTVAAAILAGYDAATVKRLQEATGAPVNQ